ncbi:MAG TPA: hypothetical protein VFF59_11665 [Anaerolineae bacterium]|nr:hypothetical protein [Anaerolineae bacterium]
MIRPFDLRDLPLVAQIEHQGTPLFAELALTRRPRPLQSALAGFFSLNTQGVRSYVLREGDEVEKLSGLIQVRDRGDRKYAIVTYVAPGLQANHHTAEIWGRLLDHVAAQSGKLGVQHVIAEAPEDSAALEVLQRAGYAIYLRQDILRLVRTRLTIQSEPLLRPCEARDQWGVQQLYMNTVPRLAQLAEGLPRMYRTGAVRGYVLEDQLEIVAYLQVRRGPDGAWFNVFVHPRAELKAAAIIEYGLSLFGSNWNAPIYCSVRRYQEWLHHPLELLGFEAFGASAVLVKHLVSLIGEPEPVKVHALESHANVTAQAAPRRACSTAKRD